MKNSLKEEKDGKEILEMSKISLILDDYNDLFSDFDPRGYSGRALSDDFLLEAKKASRDKKFGGLELTFLVPSNTRNLDEERIIKKRLREHFKKHSESLKKEFKNIINLGILFSLIGVIIMVVATFILFKQENAGFITSFLIILFEPAGWFFFWEGLGQIIFESRNKKPELNFYKKMSKCTINFLPYKNNFDIKKK